MSRPDVLEKKKKKREKSLNKRLSANEKVAVKKGLNKKFDFSSGHKSNSHLRGFFVGGTYDPKKRFSYFNFLRLAISLWYLFKVRCVLLGAKS